ncbi:serine/threonine protein kinase [Bacillus sp. R1-10]
MIKVNSVKAHLNLDQWKSIGEEGRNSDVWIARDTQLEQILILKKITKKSLDQQKITDYFAEAKILNDSKHPNIMPIHYSAEDDENIFITMPYYENGSLNSLIDKKYLTSRDIIKYSLDFLSGLLYIHIKGLLHLDIKPTNVIIDNANRAILTDFGLSKYLDEDGTVEQQRHYKPHATPNFSLIRKVEDDIYQAGLTLYRMCNGNVDFNTQFDDLLTRNNYESLKIYSDLEKGIFPDRKKYLPHIPKKLIKIINTMLHVDEDKRYKNILEIINDLSKLEENLDWKYEIINSEREFLWELEQKTSIIKIKLLLDNHSYLTSGEKYVKKSGNTLQIKNVKKKHNDLKTALAFIESKLIEYS